jgi:hypothetical protein
MHFKLKFYSFMLIEVSVRFSDVIRAKIIAKTDVEIVIQLMTQCGRVSTACGIPASTAVSCACWPC